MKLNELNIHEIRLGLKLVSSIGTLGEIVEIIKEDDNHLKNVGERVRFDTIIINWNNGNKSRIFHLLTDNIDIYE
jgi:hypothetical protein